MRQLLIVLLALFAAQVAAQRFPFTVVSARDGLPQSSVFKIIQDPQGYIWFATEGGIARYDGYEFRNYSTHDGIGAQFISDTETAPGGTLWISTLGKGIAWFDGLKFHNISRNNGLPSNQIRCLRFFGTTLWLASSDSGVIRIDQANTPQVMHFPNGNALQSAWKLMQDSKGVIWSAGRDGIVRFDPGRGFSPELIIPASRTMLSLFQDSDGAIWAGGVGQLYCIRNDSIENFSEMVPEKCRTVWDIYRERKGQPLMLATMGGLCLITDTGTNVLTSDNGLPDNQIRDISPDRFGNLWLGTYGGGAMIYQEHGMQHFDRSAEGLILPTFALAEDGQGRIWLGTDAYGYFIYEAGMVRRCQESALQESLQPIASISDSRNGDLWIAGMNGSIHRIQDNVLVQSWLPGSGQDMFVLRFCQMQDGNMLLATKAGVYLLNERMTAPEQIRELPPAYFRGAFRDDFGYIWFLGDEGEVFRFKDGKAEDMTPKLNPDRYNFDDGLYDSFHGLWWFCSNAGLVIYDGNRTAILHSKNGLHSDSPWSITQDSTGNIWIGHEKGVERILVDQHTIEYYGIDQGFMPVETNSAAAITDSHGDVWFGTISSATRIKITGVTQDTSLSVVRIQGIFDGMIPIYEEHYTDTLPELVTLNHDQNDLVFKFVALSFQNPGDVQYSWYLEGQDHGWKPWSGRREAVYNNLAPGTYTFRIVARDPSGRKTAEQTVLIEIRKPFWNRAWFYMMEILFLGLIIYLSFRYSANPSQNKLGSILTLVSILVIFESFNIVISGYLDRFTGGIPVYQLVMNVILAASLQPLEQVIRKFMKQLARRRAVQLGASHP